MENHQKYKFEDDRSMSTNYDDRYEHAYKKVKRIKGFYIHLALYVLINTCLIATNNNQKWDNSTNFWQWETFSTALFWGIGLVAHGLSVFGRDLFFGTKWEERKIEQLMKKSKKERWE